MALALLKVTQEVPVGTVSPFAGASAPFGYLLCNGQAVSRATYASLFAAIGVSHGYGDGSTTFNLPDYRGRFLRGIDGGTGRDPNAGSRTAMNSGGATGNNIGSIQDDAFQGHWHDVYWGGVGGTYQSWTAGSSDRLIGAATTQVGQVAAYPRSDGVNGTPRTSSESRPKNANVNYIIKY